MTTLAVLYVEYLKEAVTACAYSFPVSIKWATRETFDQSPTKRLLWLYTTSTDRHDPLYQRESLRVLAAKQASMLSGCTKVLIRFAVDCRWFVVTEDESETRFEIFGSC
jgi:hypothetical protein